jgi:hypothetical protein
MNIDKLTSVERRHLRSQLEAAQRENALDVRATRSELNHHQQIVTDLRKRLIDLEGRAADIEHSLGWL